MTTSSLTTYVCLPPGLPSGKRLLQFLRSAFEDYGWFQPRRYGVAFLDKPIEPSRIDYASLISFYEERGTLCVAAQTNRDFLLFHPAKPAVPPYTGRLTWVTSAKKAVKPSWRAEHLRQVTDVMRMLEAPLAQAAIEGAFAGKAAHRVPAPDGFGQIEELTLRDYSEGLIGLFWRNFFGPPFMEMFGERLHTLPAESKQELGEGLVLVQPYELPTEAGTAEGVERERQLIAHLGPECFYDHERHLKPSRRPRLRGDGR